MKISIKRIVLVDYTKRLNDELDVVLSTREANFIKGGKDGWVKTRPKSAYRRTRDTM